MVTLTKGENPVVCDPPAGGAGVCRDERCGRDRRRT